MKKYMNFALFIAFVLSLALMSAIPYHTYSDTKPIEIVKTIETFKIDLPKLPTKIVFVDKVKEVPIPQINCKIITKKDTVLVSSRYWKMDVKQYSQLLSVPRPNIPNLKGISVDQTLHTEFLTLK